MIQAWVKTCRERKVAISECSACPCSLLRRQLLHPRYRLRDYSSKIPNQTVNEQRGFFITIIYQGSAHASHFCTQPSSISNASLPASQSAISINKCKTRPILSDSVITKHTVDVVWRAPTSSKEAVHASLARSRADHTAECELHRIYTINFTGSGPT